MECSISASDISTAKVLFKRFSELFDQTMLIVRTSKEGFNDPTVAINTDHLEELANAIKSVAGHPSSVAPSTN